MIFDLINLQDKSLEVMNPQLRKLNKSKMKVYPLLLYLCLAILEQQLQYPNHHLKPISIEALENLRILKDEKLWQNGFEKEYHIRLSDIIRTYIEKRYGVTALEQTTDEIMRHTRTLESIDEVLRNKLKQILMLSDMVKFAKELPLPNENEMSIDNAFEFVNKTVLIQKIEQNENLNNSNI